MRINPKRVTRRSLVCLSAFLFSACWFNKNNSGGSPQSGGGPVSVPLNWLASYSPYQTGFLAVPLLTLPDNSLLLGSATGSNQLFKVLPNGSLDSSFASGGISSFTVNSAGAVGRQSNGSFILATTNGVVRISSTGVYDASFAASWMDPYFPVGSSLYPISFVNVLSDDSVILGGNQGVIHLAANGTVDQTFGEGGLPSGSLPITGSNSQPAPFFQAVAPDGHIYILCQGSIRVSSTFDLVRYLPNGTLDINFGTAGILKSDFSALLSETPADTPGDGLLAPWLYIQSSDGKIILGGVTTKSQVGLVRLNTNGTLDTTFGTQGLGAFPPNNGGFLGFGRASNGDFIQASVASPTLYISQIDLNGNPISSYGTSGVVSVAVPSGVTLSNFLVDSSNSFRFGGVYGASPQAASFSVNFSGLVNSSFGNQGLGTYSLPGSAGFSEVETQSDGKLLAVVSYAGSSMNYTKLIRFLPTGQNDLTFGNDGVLALNLGPIILPATAGAATMVNAVTEVNGLIYVAGVVEISTVGGQAFLLRLNAADGSIDTNFGANGFYLPPIVASNENGLFRVVPNSDGSLYVLGLYPGTISNDLHLLKLTSAGQLDMTFGTQGTIELPQTPICYNGGLGCSVLVNNSGEVLVAYAAISGSSTSTSAMIFAYNSTGVPESSFGNNGSYTVPGSMGFLYNRSPMALQSDGRILVSYYSSSTPFVSAPLVERISSVGTLDITYGDGGSTNLADVDPLLLVNGGGNSFAATLKLGSDNSAYLVGVRAPDASFTQAFPANAVAPYEGAIVKLTPQGDPDPNFGSQGEALSPYYMPSIINGVTFDANGNLIFATSSGYNLPGFEPALLCFFSQNGTPCPASY